MDKEYKDGDTIYLLMKEDIAGALMEDWVSQGFECDIIVHRSKKTKGCVVVETKDVIWASRIIQWYRPMKVKYLTT